MMLMLSALALARKYFANFFAAAVTLDLRTCSQTFAYLHSYIARTKLIVSLGHLNRTEQKHL